MTKLFKTLILAGLLISTFLLLAPVLFPLTGLAGSDWLSAIGRFHILVLHFPIALLLTVPLLELLGMNASLQFVRQTVPVILLMAILFAVKACVLGYMLAMGEGDNSTLLISHMRLGILTTILMMIAFVIRAFSMQLVSRKIWGCYWTVLGAAIFTLTLGSHDGASLVHGKDYLYAKLPVSIKRVLGEATPGMPLTEESSIYQNLIRPIFKEHCFTCHSVDKDKGDFRMDDFERLLYGGESGMDGIVPGNLEDSEVHYRITLPPDSKGFMPPEGKAPLTTNQVALISWWIKNGASPTQKIGELKGM